MIWVYLVVLTLPLLVGLTSIWWFWWMPTFRKLRSCERFDKEAFNLPKETLTLLQIREYRDPNSGLVGDKIVLVHHLYPAAEKAQDDIYSAGIALTVALGVAVMAIALIGLSADPKAGVLPWQAGVSLVARKGLTFVAAPIGIMLFALNWLYSVLGFRSQVRRYKKLLT